MHYIAHSVGLDSLLFHTQELDPALAATRASAWASQDERVAQAASNPASLVTQAHDEAQQRMQQQLQAEEEQQGMGSGMQVQVVVPHHAGGGAMMGEGFSSGEGHVVQGSPGRAGFQEVPLGEEAV